MAEQTQTAYSTSAFTDPQNIASGITFITGLLALPEVVAVIPLKYMPAILAISAALNLLLRIAFGVRPVSFIAPTQVKPVEIPKLEKTQQGTETK
jgi:hypothetical protein